MGIESHLLAAATVVRSLLVVGMTGDVLGREAVAIGLEAIGLETAGVTVWLEAASVAVGLETLVARGLVVEVEAPALLGGVGCEDISM